MKRAVSKSIYKHRYLAIVAVCMYLLSLVFSATWSINRSPASIKKLFENYIRRAEASFITFATDTATLSEVINADRKPKQAASYYQQDIGLFVYTENDMGNLLLSFWNTNKCAPQQSDLKLPDGKYVVTYSSSTFEFIKKTILLNGHVIVVAGLVPIQWAYFMENRYLTPHFPALGLQANQYQVTLNEPKISIHSSDGKFLFGLNNKKQTINSPPGGWSVLFKVLAIGFLLAFVNMLAYDVSRKRGWEQGIIFLISSVLTLRIASYLFPFPFRYRNLELFDPTIYASNIVHPSLGDLLVNTILLFWIVSFFKYTAIQPLRHRAFFTGRKAWNITILISVFLLAVCFTGSNIIRSLVLDSKISLDVAHFFKLNIYSLITFVTLCFITLSFFYIAQVLILLANKSRGVPAYAKYLAITIAGLLYLTINVEKQPATVNMAVLSWLLACTYLLEWRKSDIYIPLMRSPFFLLWLVWFAASISALTIVQTHKLELEERKADAMRIASQSDPSSENIVNIGIGNFGSFLVVSDFHRFYYENENKKIKDSLVKENFSAFINKYDTRIYTFDSTTRPLYNEDTVLFETVLNYIETQSRPTNTPDVYYYENSFNRLSFFYFKEVKDQAQKILGYFFVLANPKKYKSEALYPELFRQSKDTYNDYDITGAYAVYNKGQIMMHSGDYNFVASIGRSAYPKGDFKEVKRNGYSELWHNAGADKIVVVVRGSSVIYEAVTLFAYLFGTILFIVVLFQTAQFFIRAKFKWSLIVSNLRLTIRNQIQATIIFISVFSFIVIAGATIIFYINRFDKNNRQRLVKSVTIVSNALKQEMASYSTVESGFSNYDIDMKAALERTISDIAEIHSIDVNYYDLSGNLKFSTQPYIYRKQVVSAIMEPRAYHAVHFNQEIQVIQEETIGNFTYTSIYSPVRDDEGNPYAYINVPYLSSEAELEQEISNFLVTLINLNAFIFVFAGAIAFMVTNKITRSFTLITSKMKEVNLGKANEEIQWNTNDEIGALVNEYNKMVRKLEESAQALAKSEREGAWREMARQVAHEIKNPLTPMKLSIQYLQRSIKENNPDIELLSKRVADTLVEQIDQLAKIASDFSQFAHLENVKLQVFDIHEVLASLIDLYSTNESLDINWNKQVQPLPIYADRNQINRLFTNLLQNAIEASSGPGKIEIIIVEKIVGQKAIISLTDKGQGIPAEKHDKIFTPNFTTKSSGTGLGLAICKGIVEKANGKIWFETAEGEGTTFHILLPIV